MCSKSGTVCATTSGDLKSMLFLLPRRQISKFFYRRSCEIYCTVAKRPLLAAIRLNIFSSLYLEAVKTGEWTHEILTNVNGDFIKMYVHTSQIRSSSLLNFC